MRLMRWATIVKSFWNRLWPPHNRSKQMSSERMAYNDGFDSGYEKAKKRIDELESSLAQAQADLEALLTIMESHDSGCIKCISLYDDVPEHLRGSSTDR